MEAKALVLAFGAHDGALAFEGNDVPGVMSARAAGLLLADGALAGERIAIVVTEGGGPFGASFARAAASLAKVELIEGEPLVVKGSSHAKGVKVKTSGGEKDISADLVLIDAPRAPAYELCEQAGAKLRHEPRGYVAETDGGRIGEGMFAVGEVAGAAFDAAAIETAVAGVVARILS
jgi:hypothetical protein